MTANELRIGNWVYHEPSVNETTNGEFIVSEINVFDKNSINGLESSDVKPIPLTEEWLLRFGFESDNNEPNEIYSVDISTGERYDYVSTLRIIVMDDFCLVDIVEKGTHPRADESIVTLKSIKHVHQLQNLYFALTGEELTLKQ
jgi:hypothetical protein